MSLPCVERKYAHFCRRSTGDSSKVVECLACSTEEKLIVYSSTKTDETDAKNTLGGGYGRTPE